MNIKTDFGSFFLLKLPSLSAEREHQIKQKR